jgi:hypothetical protein
MYIFFTFVEEHLLARVPEREIMTGKSQRQEGEVFGVHTIVHRWHDHNLLLELMPDGRIVVEDRGRNPWSLPSVYMGVLMTDLQPIIKRLKRACRRGGGLWFFELELMNNYGKCTGKIPFDVGKSDVRLLVLKFERILKARADLGLAV